VSHIIYRLFDLDMFH